MLLLRHAPMMNPTREELITTVGPPDCPTIAAPVSAIFCFLSAGSGIHSERGLVCRYGLCGGRLEDSIVVNRTRGRRRGTRPESNRA